MSAEKIVQLYQDHEEQPKELKLALERINRAIEKAVTSGELRLLLIQFPQLCLLEIMTERHREFHYLAQISQMSQRRVSELEQHDNPFDLVLPSEIFDPHEMAKELPAFINSHYPVANGLPIIIYRSKQDFLSNKPFLAVKSSGNLVAVNAA